MLKIIFAIFLGAQSCWASSTYILADIQQQADVYTGSICKPYTNGQKVAQEADFRCGQKISVVRSPQKDQIAFLETNQNKTFDLFHSALLKRNQQCEDAWTGEISDLFNSSLCRAFRSPKLSTEDNDVFLFVPNMKPEPIDDADPVADAVARAILFGAYTGVPVGVASMDVISIPKIETLPHQLVIEETRIGVAFFVKVITHRQFIFQNADR